MTTDTLDPTDMASLVEIQTKDALAVFTTKDAIEPILARVKREIDKHVPDVSTAAGRDAVRSLAHTVTKSKTALLAVGKKLAAEQKEIPNKIDATRRRIEDQLDQWRDEFRRPLTAWEDNEKDRVNHHKATIASIAGLGELAKARDVTASRLHDALTEVEGVQVTDACEEFVADYATTKLTAIEALRPALAAKEKQEADHAELERLRAEEAERVEAERIERIKKEAADAARLEAENDARVEREKLANAAKLAATESARKDAEHKAAVVALERKAIEAAATAKRELDDKLQAEKAEEDKRAADKKHRATINRAALAALVDGGIPESTAKTVIKLIATGAVPSINIAY